MTNRKQYEVGPCQDVDLVRREMMAKLIGKHQTDEIERFFNEKVRPAHWDFTNRFYEIPWVARGRERIKNTSDLGILHGQVNKFDPNDYYGVMKSGIEVTG